MKIVTSATLRAGRPAEPEKITSSISLPRIEVGRVSPITQRMASNRLDLPQPLGPITAVRPGSMKSSVGSTKDLKPESLSRVNFKKNAPYLSRSLGLLGDLGVEDFLQLVVRNGARRLRHAIQDESGRGVDGVFLFGFGRHLVDPLVLGLVGDAL